METLSSNRATRELAMLKNSPKTSYSEIKASALDVYYDFARDHGLKLGRSLEQVLGAVSYDLDNVYDDPLEQLMASVVQLVLSGGWFTGPAEFYRTEISQALKNEGIRTSLNSLPLTESSLFLHDLRILGFDVE